MATLADWLDTAQASIAGIVALVAAASAAFWRIWGKLRPILRLMRREKRGDRNHKVRHRAHLALEKFVASSECARALLLTATNCGWLDPLKPITICAIDEAVRDVSTPRVFERWQEWRADPAYSGLIGDLWESRKDDRGVLLVTSEMPPGVLRDYYEETGIAASVVFFVTTAGDDASKDKDSYAVVYVSLNFGCLHDGHCEVDACDLAAEEEKARKFYRFPERIRRKAWHMRSILKADK